MIFKATPLDSLPTNEILVGRQIKSINIPIFKDGKWIKFNTKEEFKGKKVVLCGLPGAFTPKCSSSMLPGYSRLQPLFESHGVDDIYVASVNDSFVMNAWLKDQEITNIKPLSDGNGEFTSSLGFLVDKSSDLGFGFRSWRYSMLIDDGVIMKAFIEPNEPGDPFHVSDAYTMLNYLAPEAKVPDFITVVTKIGCRYCEEAKDQLKQEGIKFQELVLGDDISHRTISILTGFPTYPQIFKNGTFLGGSHSLKDLIIEKNK